LPPPTEVWKPRRACSSRYAKESRPPRKIDHTICRSSRSAQSCAHVCLRERQRFCEQGRHPWHAVWLAGSRSRRLSCCALRETAQGARLLRHVLRRRSNRAARTPAGKVCRPYLHLQAAHRRPAAPVSRPSCCPCLQRLSYPSWASAGTRRRGLQSRATRHVRDLRANLHAAQHRAQGLRVQHACPRTDGPVIFWGPCLPISFCQKLCTALPTT
jgi:hypothetical protein